MKEILSYGCPDSSNVLIQLVDDYSLEIMGSKVDAIMASSQDDFQLIAVKVERWNHDLSPWKAPAVFGTEPFGDGASDTLKKVLTLTGEPGKEYYIGGYSLAGLFALWASTRTDVFKGVAAASPSVWFPDFDVYIKDNGIKADRVYLSLGDKEEKTKNPVMATVGERIRGTYELLKSEDIDCTLEWNEGSHFKDAMLRTAGAFAWIINTLKE
jgi:hypothetical protein